MRSLLVLFCFFEIFFPSFVAAQTLEFLISHYPPYEYLEGESPKGVITEVVQEACRRAGFSLVIREVPWPRALDRMRHGQADGVFHLMKTLERAEYLQFTDSIGYEESIFIVRKGSGIAWTGDFTELADKRIGIQVAYSYGKNFDMARQQGIFRHLDPVLDTQSALKKLLAGRIDVLVGYQLSAVEKLRKLGALGKVEFLVPSIQKDKIFIGLSRYRKLDGVRERINRGLRSMRADGTFSAIMGKYLQ